MQRHRLFIGQPITRNQYLEVDADTAHYLTRVLRMKPGSELTVFEGNGYEYPAVVTEIGKHKTVLRAGEPVLRDVESPLSVRLIQGVSRGERMDLVVQKATELGVHSIIPVITEYTVVKLKPKRAERRLDHWRKIARGACEQCGRNRLPEIAGPLALTDYLQEASTADQRLLLDPGAGTPITSLEDSAAVVDLLVGPEGGLSPSERETAGTFGFHSVSMGPRILRSETAALTALALVQARWGDLQA